MLFDIMVAILILLCGVAVYFALLGLIVLYNKFSAENVFNRPQESKIITAELEETKPDIQMDGKKKIPLGKLVQHIKEMRLPKPTRQKIEKPQTQDPLHLEHKKREEEFRFKMQQRNEELLRELKQRREESSLEQDAAASFQKDFISADKVKSDATNNLDNTGS